MSEHGRKNVAIVGARLTAVTGAIFAAVHSLASVAWLPSELPAPMAEVPTLCVRDYLTPAQGEAVLQAALMRFDTGAAWKAYGETVRGKIQEGAGLAPWPRRTPLQARFSARRAHDGYTVENVTFEPVPGVLVGGNLYRPRGAQGPSPAVLTTHGHTGEVKTEADWARHGRFHESVQRRAATLARMGAVVLALDMFGYGDSWTQFGPASHRRPFALTLQTWTARRALDLLLALDGVDSARVAVTGESGGGTQAILLTALDERVTLSVPVAMVSAYFFGGCPCESGMPIHRSAEHFASNAMIAALAAPRPQLLVSNGGDWTQHTPCVELPFLQAVYARLGAPGNVANVHLPDEGHNYGPSKRAAMYRFVAEQFGLRLDSDESKVALEPPDTLRGLKGAGDLPAHALRTVEQAEAALRALQTGRE
jgi:hypothetical protein